MKPRWPTPRECVHRLAVITYRATIRSLVVAAMLEIYIAARGVS